MKPVPYIAASIILSILSPPLSAYADTPIPAALAAANADPRRPAEQVKLDSARKPAQLLAFAELKPGDRVADFMSACARSKLRERNGLERSDREISRA